MTIVASGAREHSAVPGSASKLVLVRNGDEPIRAELCGPTILEELTRELARIEFSNRPDRDQSLLGRLRDNQRFLEETYRQLAIAARQQETLTPDAEWLLDNFYIIEEVLREVRNDLPRGYYVKLPTQSEGPLAGLPRIYALALTLVAHTDSSLNEGQILHFVQIYQSVTPLTIGELWAIPTMLRLALIENLRRLAAQLLRARQDREAAIRWAEQARALPEGADTPPPSLPASPSDGFLVSLLQAVRDTPLSGSTAILVHNWMLHHDPSTSEALRREYQRQAGNQVSIGNSVTSLRLLSVLDWNLFFERASLVEQVLRTEPTGIYIRQDFATRDRYRRVVERLARGSKLTEVAVAQKIIDRVQGQDDPRRSHLGWHLVAEGRKEFQTELNYRPTFSEAWRQFVTGNPNLIYFGLLTIFIVAGISGVLALIGPTSWGMVLLVAVLLLLPASEVAVALTNFLICHLLSPNVLPRLDFKEGIPPEYGTFVVIPGMLTRPEGVSALVERLELHYLANPDPQLSFALLTDFADASTEHTAKDNELVRLALEEIEALNKRHAGDRPRFFLFHRKRQWNPAADCWMGWERKRGKLEEFNRLLRGDTETSYTILSTDLSSIPHVPFVLTLDADTELPRETARRLISTLAHPLNRPVISPDGRCVVRGYGLLQPRVTFLFRTGLRSWFAAIYASSAGVDPYSSAVSDVYQDLFGRGTFTGKGLYDVDAFMATAGSAFPDNHILSHDLIESTLARCALVSDVEVFDDFPSRYHAYARREHRWVRGDWQLLPWLGPRVPLPSGKQIVWAPNVLPLLERWKIVDNLRRSLVPPALVLLLVLGWTLLPGSWLWTILALVVVSTPLALQLVEAGMSVVRGASGRALLNQARYSLGATAGQVSLAFIFLLDQARLMVDAISRTLFRLFISQRHLLEWETAAATEARLGTGWKQFVVTMGPTSLLSVGLAVLVFLVAPGALPAALPVLCLWVLSPVVAFVVSRPRHPHERPLSDKEERDLRKIARKTWGFFETFVSLQDHWLPPDNYQEDPKGQIAHRTSPTNMGMLFLSTLTAHDLGYLSLSELGQRIAQTLDTLGQLERYRGHFYNWYETTTLHPLQPHYISTVDSGNLFASLLVLKQGLLEKLDEPLPERMFGRGLADALELVADELLRLRQDSPKIPDVWSKLAGEVRDLQNLVEHAGIDLLEVQQRLEQFRSGWETVAGQLRGLGDLMAATPEQLLRWTGRVREQLRAREEELRALAPWLSALQKWDSAGNEDRQNIRKELTALRSVSAWERSLPGLRDRLTALHGESADGQIEQLIPALDSAAPQWAQMLRDLAEQADKLTREMDFHFLYSPERALFAIGFNASADRMDQAHYDLLASEAALTCFLAVARGDAPRKHWFQLGRLSTHVAGLDGLISWGGTMFEYLMPRLLLPVPPGTLLDVAQHAAVARQIEYGRQRGLPWGISESAFNVLDVALDYQYQSFGVPGLGLKRGLSQDLVVAPYATLLAVPVAPHEALANLDRLRSLGGEGPYGFYEAVDFTPARLPKNKTYQVIHSYMAHHQGMGLTAVGNQLTGNALQRRLRAEPMVRASELLLQERVPVEAPLVRPHEEAEGGRQVAPAAYPVSRQLNRYDTPAPRTHLLSGRRTSVLLTNAGGGISRRGQLDVTRWSPDRTCDDQGSFIYIRDVQSNHFWSAAYQPTRRTPESYQVIFSIDKVEFRREDDGIETHTEITVSPEKDVEVRRVTLINTGAEVRELEITSYLEVVLLQHEADTAHPAFGKLFIETEWLEGPRALLARRRPRSAEQVPVWAIHVMAVEHGESKGEVEYETDRAKFLGRRRTTADPEGLHATLSGTTGPVLDPIFSLRRRFLLEPGHHVMLAFATGVADSREEAVSLADAFQTSHAIIRTFELAWAHSRVELRHLNLSEEDAHLYQKLAGHILLPGSALRAAPEMLVANRQGQVGLWRHGISGDLPIALVHIQAREEMPLFRQCLAAHSYCRTKGLVFDLVVLVDEVDGYFEQLSESALGLVRSSDDREFLDRPGGIFVRRSVHLNEADRILLYSAARVVLEGGRGLLGTQIDTLERLRTVPPRRKKIRGVVPAPAQNRKSPQPGELLFDNGLGGFTPDGKNYLIHPGAVPPAPWINVIANPACGFFVTDSGAGYTWAGNSQTNRLTPWRNDPVSDPISEAVYVRDDDTGEIWCPTPTPVPGSAATTVRHGQGYTAFSQQRDGIEQELTLFVAVHDPVKIIHLRLRNRGPNTRRLSATFFAEWVLGTVREQCGLYVITEQDENSGTLLAWNPFSADFGTAIAFADINLRPRGLTADRVEFLGRNGSAAFPAALTREGLSGRTGPALDPCAALQGSVELKPGTEQAVVFVLGQAADRATALNLARRYRQPTVAIETLRAVLGQWDHLLGAVQVETPNKGMDLLLNRWLLYQVTSCRLWGRSAFYQSGGAYGFRDQLQDVMALVHAAPEETRAQLLRAARRQFSEGDVQHWWHPPTGKGVRTRFSDDFLWLPFVACYYAASTGDQAIWQERIPFLRAAPLAPGQEEVYGQPLVAEETGTLYEHCVRALDNGWKLGSHGLPLMGTGDWNDGMNKVGAGGKGESVWVAWFQIVILTQFAAVARQQEEQKRAEEYLARVEQLRQAIEQHAWDGAWYRRAYFDDGTPLGSASNEACQIDSLTQTWAVFSRVAEPTRAEQSMQAILERLVRWQDRLILLFDPPFDDRGGPEELHPGYIKGYVPGIRENGGQYTHAATWVVQAVAEAATSQGEQAHKLWNLLNPITHASTPEEVALYRVEPYVVAADVYGRAPHVGRGGWTWYTGSASWLYRVALETLLGFHREGDRLRLRPCIPADWNGFRVVFRYRTAVYRIEVDNSRKEGADRPGIWLDGQPVEGESVPLLDDGHEHEMKVVLGR